MIIVEQLLDNRNTVMSKNVIAIYFTITAFYMLIQVRKGMSGVNMQEKILLIEDDEIMNAGLCYNLQKRNVTPFPVYCIEEAKMALKDQSFI